MNFSIVFSGCEISLVNGVGYYIPDAAITASSCHADCSPAWARAIDEDTHRAWCTGNNTH